MTTSTRNMMLCISLNILMLTFVQKAISTPQGFHFNRFSGPVSGPISRVQVATSQHGGPGQAVDYVAKPDYNFAYGVEDPLTGNYQNQKEVRDGDVVKGEYSFVDAEGVTRRVTYTADSVNGFQATVHNSEPNSERAGQQARFASTLQQQQNHHHQQQQQYPALPKYQPIQSQPQHFPSQHQQHYNDDDDDY